MPNSATGGFLVQTASTLDGLALRRFLQSIIAGVTGLGASLVRPMWQPDPPPVPSINVDWCGFAITDQRIEKGSAFHQQLTDGATITRHEEIDLLCAFYGPDSLTKAGELRDGMELSQNRELLFLSGMGLAGFNDIAHAPELVNDRYFDRADITMTVRREIRRSYAILNFVSATGTIKANRGVESLTSQITVTA